MGTETEYGIIVPGNQPLSVFDFVYPENPYLLRPLVLRAYFNGAPVVFQIENVMWHDGGLAFDIVMPDAVPATNVTRFFILNNNFAPS